MKEKYNTLLDTIYELEGLVHLAIVRGEDAPKRINALLREKIGRISEIGERLQITPLTQSQSEETEVLPDTVEPEISETEEIEEYVVDEEVEDPKEETSSESEEEEESLTSETFVEKKREPVFSLNDRFLFIREIFCGDAKAFAHEMARLDDFDDYDEAEQYFLEEYTLDPDSPAAQNFLSVVERYYQS